MSSHRRRRHELLFLVVIASILLLSTTPVVTAEPQGDGREHLEFLATTELRAHGIGESAESAADPRVLAEIHRRAEQLGEPDAVYLLAMLKLYGQGQRRDVPGAVQLLKRLNGHRDAEFALGVLHLHGDDGLARNDRLGAAWLGASANRGHVDAQWMLATLYNDGRGVDRVDPVRARELLEAAARAENPHALFHLGVMEEYGRGHTDDRPATAAAAPAGAGSGPRPDFARAAELYRAAIATEDDQLRAHPGRRASAAATPAARYYLSLLYAGGRGVPENAQLARRLLREAADDGHPQAMYRLGDLLTTGDDDTGTPIDYTEALVWFKRTAACGRGDRWLRDLAGQRAAELQELLLRAEARVQALEQDLGRPLRVHIEVATRTAS